MLGLSRKWFEQCELEKEDWLPQPSKGYKFNEKNLKMTSLGCIYHH